jgi:hypothetical protein
MNRIESNDRDYTDKELEDINIFVSNRIIDND